MLITHDLAVVAETCERVVVMYGGEIQEVAPVAELFARPLHPYTLGLLDSLPRPDRETRSAPAHDPRHGAQHPRHARRAASSARAATAWSRAASAKSRPCARSATGTSCVATWSTGRWARERAAIDAAGRHGASRPRGPRASARRGARRALPHLRRPHAAQEGRGARGRRSQLRHPARRDAGPGRRVRLRQEHGGAGPAQHPLDHALRTWRSRATPTSRASAARWTCSRSAAASSGPYRSDLQMIFQDPYSLAQPAAHSWTDQLRSRSRCTSAA